jgi:hypothetical protein
MLELDMMVISLFNELWRMKLLSHVIRAPPPTLVGNPPKAPASNCEWSANISG